MVVVLSSSALLWSFVVVRSLMLILSWSLPFFGLVIVAMRRVEAKTGGQ